MNDKNVNHLFVNYSFYVHTKLFIALNLVRTVIIPYQLAQCTLYKIFFIKKQIAANQYIYIPKIKYFLTNFILTVYNRSKAFSSI